MQSKGCSKVLSHGGKKRLGVHVSHCVVCGEGTGQFNFFMAQGVQWCHILVCVVQGVVLMVAHGHSSSVIVWKWRSQGLGVGESL